LYFHTRSAPIVHKPTLKIGLEGGREFTLSSNQDFPAYNVREISSARPGGRYRPSSVTTGRAIEGPLMARTELRSSSNIMQDLQNCENEKRFSSLSSRDEKDISPKQASSSRTFPQNKNNSSLYIQRQKPDLRFAAGSTTRSAYRDVSAYNEEARPKSVKPLVSLKMEGDFSRSVSSKEHFKPLPYSRTPVTIRKSMIEAPSGRFESATTYRDQSISDKTQFNGLRRSSRFDYSLRIPDKIDWL